MVLFNISHPKVINRSQTVSILATFWMKMKILLKIKVKILFGEKKKLKIEVLMLSCFSLGCTKYTFYLFTFWGSCNQLFHPSFFLHKKMFVQSNKKKLHSCKKFFLFSLPFLSAKCETKEIRLLLFIQRRPLPHAWWNLSGLRHPLHAIIKWSSPIRFRLLSPTDGWIWFIIPGWHHGTGN